MSTQCMYNPTYWVLLVDALQWSYIIGMALISLKVFIEINEQYKYNMVAKSATRTMIEYSDDRCRSSSVRV